MNNLLVSAGVVLDIVFFIILALGLFMGVKRGFWRGICAIAGTIFSLAIGVVFCRRFQYFIDETLGIHMTQAIQGGLGKTIPSELIANSLGEWIAIAISFLILVLLVRLLAWLVGKLGKALVEKSKVFRVFDRLLGGILGLVQAMLLLSIIFSICYWLPWEGLHNFISSSSVISKIYEFWIPLIADFPKLIFKDTTPAQEEEVAYLAMCLGIA